MSDDVKQCLTRKGALHVKQRLTKSIFIGVRVDESLYNLLRQIAQEEERKISEIIRLALKRYLSERHAENRE